MLNSRYIDTASLQDLQLNNVCGEDEEGDVELGSHITVLINCVTLQYCWGNALQSGRAGGGGFDSRWCHWSFSLT